MDYTPVGRVGEDGPDPFCPDHINKEGIHISHHQPFGRIDSTDVVNALQPWNTSGQSDSGLDFPEWLVAATDSELGCGRISDGVPFTDTAAVSMEDCYPQDRDFVHTAPCVYLGYGVDPMIEIPELVPPTPCLTDTFSVQDFYATPLVVTPAYSEPSTDAVYSQTEDYPKVSSGLSSTSIPGTSPVPVNNLDHDYTCVARTQVDAGVIQQKILVSYDEIKSKTVFKCAFDRCQKRYTNRANLENHLYTKHYDIGHPWECLTCVGLGFTSQTSARRHKKNAQSARTTCPRCQKSYSRPDYLGGYHKKACKGLKKRIEKAL